MSAHGTADQPERYVRNIEIGKRTDLADAVHLRRPLVDVIDLDQTNVQVYIDVVAAPAGIEVLEEHTAELYRRGRADFDLIAADDGADAGAGLPGDVAVGEGEGFVSVRYKARDGSNVLPPLNVADHRIAAAHDAGGVTVVRVRLRPHIVFVYLDDADGHLLAVRHVYRRRH